MDLERTAFHDTVYRAFKYSKKELVAIEELLQQRDQASSLFYKSYFELEQKKDKALNTPNLGGPGVLNSEALKIPREDLLQNKMITKTMMYQDENNKLKEMHKFFAYLNLQLTKELSGLRDLKSQRYVKVLTELCNLQIEQLTEVDHSYCRTFLTTSSSKRVYTSPVRRS